MPTSRRTTTTSDHARPRSAGFTLIELMVVIAILGLALTIVAGGSSSVLPQSRLKASASNLASALIDARNHALLARQPFVFAYDLDAGTYESYYPYERDVDGTNVGPGKTPLRDPERPERDMRLREVRLPGPDVRTQGVIELPVSALGRIPTHAVVIDNPEYPEREVFTVRVDGLTMQVEILEGDVPRVVLADADFR